jgi:hypothetical protein
VKRCFRDLDTLKLKNLFEETDKAANAMQLSSTMHHLSWKVLSTELKVTVDKFLRQHVGFSQSIAKVNITFLYILYIFSFKIFLNSSRWMFLSFYEIDYSRDTKGLQRYLFFAIMMAG